MNIIALIEYIYLYKLLRWYNKYIHLGFSHPHVVRQRDFLGEREDREMSEVEKNEMLEAVENGEAKFQYVQVRWRSWAMWVSVIGALWTILNTLGLPEKWGIQESTFKTIVDCIGVILMAFGIVNNPTDPYNL